MANALILVRAFLLPANGKQCSHYCHYMLFVNMKQPNKQKRKEKYGFFLRPVISTLPLSKDWASRLEPKVENIHPLEHKFIIKADESYTHSNDDDHKDGLHIFVPLRGRLRIPSRVLTDSYPLCTSECFSALCEELFAKIVRKPEFHPKANAQVKVFSVAMVSGHWQYGQSTTMRGRRS